MYDEVLENEAPSLPILISTGELTVEISSICEVKMDIMIIPYCIQYTHTSADIVDTLLMVCNNRNVVWKSSYFHIGGKEVTGFFNLVGSWQ